ncbi:MAG: 23S rRNA (guanosine(2251)-2'-O)-methyltransferase RlmB [Elusimicrobia bacterium]|nr:23S rRNA (guanosine(2251)-2'-O)-methyltransferase RlmB [Elusimicrobiota bacterium]MDE2424573.1 23S rRNA (guanosine(2251)-2'-O)-methyltransferase RlmB [Elusimicrobiota bacterium]
MSRRRRPAAAGPRWLGGIHAAQETLRANPGAARELWIEHEQNSPAIKEIIGLARRLGLPVRFMARRELDRATGGLRHQGVALKAGLQPTLGLEAALERLGEEDKKNLVLVALDQIQDPHNLGAIARSAVNLGARGLILPERHSAAASPAAVQVSAGALQRIALHYVVNLAEALRRCRERGFWIYGADASGRPVWEARINAPLVLVIGSEGSGLRPLTRSLCDELVSIPQAPGGVDSLNASCAASVLLYEIARQLGRPPAGR